MGWSNGRWEGDTLVIEVTGNNDETWFDRAGNFHSDAMKVTERYTLRNPDVIDYEATIEDPKTFTRPWKISFPIYRKPGKERQVPGIQVRGIYRGVDLRTSAEADKLEGDFR